jgi:uncharacterized phage protein (TIGR02218 family)
MSYDARESSTERGSPIELYDLALGGTQYHFTSGAEPVTYTATDYEPLEISRDEVRVGPEQRTEVMTIVMPSAHPFAMSYARVVPGQRASLTIRRVHRTDSVDQELITLFKGIVRSVSFSDKAGTARIGVMPISGALARAVPRYTYKGMCNHVLFDSWCQQDPEEWNYVGEASDVDANTFTISGLTGSKGNGWATGGFATFNGDYRLILRQTSDSIKLLLPFNDDIDGEDVTIYTGCDHSFNVCGDKFANTINFGGFPFVPTKNPFQSGLK